MDRVYSNIAYNIQGDNVNSSKGVAVVISELNTFTNTSYCKTTHRLTPVVFVVLSHP
jgi:hypothetical protein